jgi:hypothetical protein
MVELVVEAGEQLPVAQVAQVVITVQELMVSKVAVVLEIAHLLVCSILVPRQLAQHIQIR